jgi:hypothetical protein
VLVRSPSDSEADRTPTQGIRTTADRANRGLASGENPTVLAPTFYFVGFACGEPLLVKTWGKTAGRSLRSRPENRARFARADANLELKSEVKERRERTGATVVQTSRLYKSSTVFI